MYKYYLFDNLSVFLRILFPWDRTGHCSARISIFRPAASPIPEDPLGDQDCFFAAAVRKPRCRTKWISITANSRIPT